MVQFLAAGLLETKDLPALQIHAGHHVPDRAVPARRVHALKDQEHGIAVMSIKDALQGGEFIPVFMEPLAITSFGGVKLLHLGSPLGQVDVRARGDAEIVKAAFEFYRKKLLAFR